MSFIILTPCVHVTCPHLPTAATQSKSLVLALHKAEDQQSVLRELQPLRQHAAAALLKTKPGQSFLLGLRTVTCIELAARFFFCFFWFVCECVCARKGESVHRLSFYFYVGECGTSPLIRRFGSCPLAPYRLHDLCTERLQ